MTVSHKKNDEEITPENSIRIGEAVGYKAIYSIVVLVCQF